MSCHRSSCAHGDPSADEEEEDTVVLVVDPLACLEGEKGISSDRGEHTEEEGIKMACPPRKVRRFRTVRSLVHFVHAVGGTFRLLLYRPKFFSV